LKFYKIFLKTSVILGPRPRSRVKISPSTSISAFPASVILGLGFFKKPRPRATLVMITQLERT